MTRVATTSAELRAALERQPRHALATLPTPLQPARRLSNELGREIWIKRDDMTGLALGGNKARKLEFSLGAAAAGGTDCLVTVGASQSNHARSVAAAARVLGWECHLVLGGERPSRPSGNLVLDSVLGACLHFTGTTEWDDLERVGRQLTHELRVKGAEPEFIPMGGSTTRGALGFVAAYLELVEQCAAFGIEPGMILHATSTGGTQAGLHFARMALGTGPKPVGVGVAKTQMDLTAEVSELVTGVSSLLGFTLEGVPEPKVLDGYLGPAYGVPTAGGQRAFSLLARTEAVLTDPVYSAKALHAVVELAEQERGGPPIVYWHTGGQPALFSDEVGIRDWQSVPASVCEHIGRAHV